MLPCLVLAGGIGSRMRPLTDHIPKALIPIAGEPFVDLQLRWLAGQGVTDVVISLGYRGAQLREHVGDGSRLGVSAGYVDEGDSRIGTGGAVRRAVDEDAVGDAFFVLYGDSYLSVRFDAVEQAWRRSRCPALMTVLRNDNRWGASNASYSRGLVTCYDKSQAGRGMRWIDYGLLVFTGVTVRQHIAPDITTDLADTLHIMSAKGLLAGLPITRRFYEIGSPAAMRELENHLRRQQVVSAGHQTTVAGHSLSR